MPTKCKFDPTKVKGAIGQMHCPDCGEMVVAGVPHPEYDKLDQYLDVDFLVNNPEKSLGSTYHDAGSCWKLIDVLVEEVRQWRKNDVLRKLVEETESLGLYDDTKPHKCSMKTPDAAWGAAITECTEDSDGTLWVDNGEYGSQVNYCPYCGKKAKVLVKAKGKKKCT